MICLHDFTHFLPNHKRDHVFIIMDKWCRKEAARILAESDERSKEAVVTPVRLRNAGGRAAEWGRRDHLDKCGQQQWRAARVGEAEGDMEKWTQKPGWSVLAVGDWNEFLQECVAVRRNLRRRWRWRPESRRGMRA